MKHAWTLLLVLLLALSLTACGGKQNETGVTSGNNDAQTDGLTGGNDNNTNGNTNGTNNNTSSANNSTNNANNSMNGTNGNTVPGDIDGDGESLFGGDNNSAAANKGTAGSAANSQNGGNPVPQSHGRKGASFDQMVRNGLVHDRDGILTDFENSVTPGSSHF